MPFTLKLRPTTGCIRAGIARPSSVNSDACSVGCAAGDGGPSTDRSGKYGVIAVGVAFRYEVDAILLEPYRAVYIETPKVACTSIKTALAEILGISLRSTGGEPHCVE